MGDEPKKLDARRLILARRATFIAAALTGVGCQKEATQPETPVVQDAGAPAPAATEAPDAAPPPRPCLKVGQPEACLKIAPPRDQK